MTYAQCDAITKSGTPCRAIPLTGTTRCFRHTQGTPTRSGGRRPLTAAPLCADIEGLDLTTAAGLAQYVAIALRRLGELPFDCKVANSISQLVTCARSTIEVAVLEGRIAALEAGRVQGTQRVA
jgi:hypothetical protein